MSFNYHTSRYQDGQYCVSPSDMQAWEQGVIKANPARGHELMEIAGREVAQHVLKHYHDVKEVLIFCGYGNNGGDGFAAAYYLERCNIQIHLFVFENEKKKRSQDAADMFERVKHIPRTVVRQPSDASKILKFQNHSDILVIDAIFGTGYKPSHNVLMSRVLHCISELNCPVVSVDIPSGIDAQTGYRGTILDDAPPKAITATETVTFGAPKFGHFWGEGPTHTGELYCVDIGLPAWSSRRMRHLLLTDDYCHEQYYTHMERAQDVYKGKCGHVVVVGGHEHMPGAACLSARAALRTGAGLVTIAARKDMRVPDEIMLAPFVGNGCGLNEDVFYRHMNQADVLVVGPGLGRDDVTLQILSICQLFRKPLILDADALWGLSQEDFKFESPELYLTPHPGEAAGLCQGSVKDVLYDPVNIINQISEKYKATTILKNHTSLIAAFSGKKIKTGISPYTNPGIASAGIGDVLAGMIGAVASQARCGAWKRWFEPFDVASIAVNMHSQAGRKATQKLGNSACASDLIQEIRL